MSDAARRNRPVSIADERDLVRAHLLAKAASDPRVVAGAVVGSLARGEGDGWSDLDLTFGVDDTVPVPDVLEDWTGDLVARFRAAHLFDVTAGPSLYRVFLLPGGLQCDLSFTPASRFGPRGPEFRLLFGLAGETGPPPARSARDLFGRAAHHVVRARVCVLRGRPRQAAFWIALARDHALERACLARGLPDAHGRGFDDLPAEVGAALDGGLPATLDREELLRALGRVVEGLLREADDVHDLATQVEPLLRRASAPGEWPGARDGPLATDPPRRDLRWDLRCPRPADRPVGRVAMPREKWFERSFDFTVPPTRLPAILERLRGTPVRLEERTRNVPAEVLTRRVDDRWSIQENVGHLLDLEPLWLVRARQVFDGAEELVAADLTNRRTHEAAHNAAAPADLLAALRAARTRLVALLETADAAVLARSARHPRLGTPMRLVDLATFVAEHDDHHLAAIAELLPGGSAGAR